VDVGSSSVRCSLYDEEGGLVKGTGASVGYGFAYTQDGGSTLDADELCNLIFGTIDETLARSAGRSIVGIASSMF
jgi:sugar (pentulose or hexulose) kinase